MAPFVEGRGAALRPAMPPPTTATGVAGSAGVTGCGPWAWTCSTTAFTLSTFVPGQDAVAEIEDVAGPALGPAQHVVDPREQPLAGGEEQRGVEVALHRHPVSEPSPALVEGRPPVEADHVAAGLAQERAGGGRCRCRSGWWARRCSRRPSKIVRTWGSTNSR